MFIVMYCLLVDDVVDFLGLIIEYDFEVVVFMEFFNSIEFVSILLFVNLLKNVLYCINNDLIKIVYWKFVCIIILYFVIIDRYMDIDIIKKF